MDDREDALSKAIELGGTDHEILRRAELFYKFLRGQLAAQLVLSVGPAVKQHNPKPVTGQPEETT